MKVFLIIIGVLIHLVFSVFMGTAIACAHGKTRFGEISEEHTAFCCWLMLIWPVTLVFCGIGWLLVFAHDAGVKLMNKKHN